MGACCSNDDVDVSRYINAKLYEENKKEIKTNKILFLGPGGSGKSTIFKQLQWLHLNGFTETDAIRLQQHIYFQIIHQMKSVIKYYENKRSYQDDHTLKEAISAVKKHVNPHELTESLARDIKYIWKNDEKIGDVFNDIDVLRFQILDESTEYFWNEIDRISNVDYIPNDSDILNVRYKTTGIIEKEFKIKNVSFHIFDVGGQKSERKKWINCFNEVCALLFVISLSCYNQMMYEDVNKNCMIDALQLFNDTINSKYFDETHIILFLNKKDLFKKKIVSIPITYCAAFNDFYQYNNSADPNDYHQTAQYIKHKFRELNKNKDKHIYSHFTYAMDRTNIDKVFLDVKRIVVTTNLAASGFTRQ